MVDPSWSSSRRDCCPDYNLGAFNHRAFAMGCLAGRPGVLQGDDQDDVPVAAVAEGAAAFALVIRVFTEAR